MINLLQIEFIKLKSNKSFWIISLFYCLVSYYIVNQANGLPGGSELFEKPLDFPMIWYFMKSPINNKQISLLAFVTLITICIGILLPKILIKHSVASYAYVVILLT